MSMDQIVRELDFCVEKLPDDVPSAGKCSDDLMKYGIPFSDAESIKKKIFVDHHCTIGDCKPQIDSEKIRLINAFCHPKVIDTVVGKYLESYSFKNK